MIMQKPERPVDGEWHWVCRADEQWFPALRDPAADGGWTNMDTWTDIHGEIVGWSLIHPPVKYTVVRRAFAGEQA